MRIEYKDKKAILSAAMGKIKSDLVITNGKIVNVFTGEILEGNIWIHQGFIVYVDYEFEHEPNALKVVDAKGQYIIPGLIDPHVHIESSMQTPVNFAKSVIPWGTTTVVTDPHEIANVWGLKGVEYMYDSSENLPMRQFIDMPSCVPAVPKLETSGADFTADLISDFMDKERIIGLAEVMDFLAVIHGEERIHDIIDLARSKNLYLQGHAPGLPSRWLSAYLCGGPNTCHETRAGKDGLTKLRYGMYVDAREGSISKNVKTVVDEIKHFKFYDTLTLCTDDREPDDILHIGHMNDVVNAAIRAGLDPITAIKSATINCARQIHFDNLGAIAPGFVADLCFVEDIQFIKPTSVYYMGELVAQDGKLVVEFEPKEFQLEVANSVNIPEISRADLEIHSQGKEVQLNCLSYLNFISSYTKLVEASFPVKDGVVQLNDDPNMSFVAVINRYGINKISVYPVQNFGLKQGAVASTVAHDCHNLVVVFKDVEDALIAIDQLKTCGGGMSAVLNREVLHTLELRVGGLMSVKPTVELAHDVELMKEADRKLGLCEQENPVLRIATLALPVIPEVKMSDVGLIDVKTQTIIPLFVK